MSEIIATIANDRKVKLTIDGHKPIQDIEDISPEDALYLSRNLMAAAFSLLGPGNPRVGSIPNSAEIPIVGWGVGTSRLSGDLALTLSLPASVVLTFSLNQEDGTGIADALLRYIQEMSPPPPPAGDRH